MRSVLHVGLDVDDKMFHGGAYCKETGEVFEFKSKPTMNALLKKLRKLESEEFELKVCYEATYVGFQLCRDLRGHDIDCEVIAPSLIPEKASDRVKTDRLDAKKLARYYAWGLLTNVHIPGEEDEQVRDLVRARSFLVDQRKDLKRHILSTCRRYGLDYRKQTGGKQYWTVTHLAWLTTTVNKIAGVRKNLFEVLLHQLEKLNESVAAFDHELEKYAEQKRYKKRKDALVCFRGLSTLSAMTLITEIGDIKRFPHPKKLMSYAGMDVREYSSGGREKKYGITKMGNRRIRTVVVESCQNVLSAPRLSRRLRTARDGQDIKIVAIADRCDARLKKKAERMKHTGKHINKIKVACAREFLAFIWEALQHTA